MYKKVLFLLFFSVFLFAFSFFVFAEESIITAEELDIEEPGIISWFKNTIDTVLIWTTNDPVKKAELELKKASRQLIKARKMIQDDPNDMGLEGRIEMINNRYEELINNINDRIEQFKQDNPDEVDKLNSFLDKYTDHQLKHQEILQNLEEQVPEQIMNKIQENRQAHLEKFGEVMTRLQNKEEFKERLENNLTEENQNTVRQTNRVRIIEELGEQDILEVRERVQEMKQEHQELFNSDDVEDKGQKNNAGELSPN